MFNQPKITALKIGYLVYLSVPILLWFQKGINTPYAYGQLFGLLMLALVALQPLLSSRLKVLERGVGHDRLMRWHGNNAKIVTVLVLLHPSLLFAKYILDGLTPLQYSRYYDSLGYLLGYVMFVLLFIIVITSLFSRKLNLKYEHWRRIHLLTYVVVFGGFVHSYRVGADIQRGLFQYWWLGLLLIALTGILHRYIVLPCKRRMYIVDAVISENGVANTVILSPEKGEKITHNPGQFAFTHFYSKSLPKEEHHFTISSAPSESKLKFTIKSLGDFTSQVKHLKKGEKIQVEGPYGAFSNAGMKGPFLFIAGGIGITPIRSMLKEMQLTGKFEKSVLLYAATGRNELVFYDELLNMSKEKWLNAKFISERHIEEKDIKEALEKLGGMPAVFLVGPEPMMKAMEKLLIKNGVPKNKIFTERFSLK